MCLCRINRRGLAGSKLSVDFKKSLFCILGRILFLNSLNYSGILAEQINKIVVTADTERTDKCRSGYLSVLIYTDIIDVIRVHLIFEPCASVGDNSRLE